MGNKPHKQTISILFIQYPVRNFLVGIFENYGGAAGKIFDNNRGHYVGEVQFLNV